MSDLATAFNRKLQIAFHNFSLPDFFIPLNVTSTSIRLATSVTSFNAGYRVISYSNSVSNTLLFKTFSPIIVQRKVTSKISSRYFQAPSIN